MPLHTGYSSLSYLNQLPFNKATTDKSFANEISGYIDDRTIVVTIIVMGISISISISISMTVVAEGVKTRKYQEYLN